MDSSRKKTLCWNSTYGCTFASSSIVDMVNHFQRDCTFHPVRCFKCNETVRKVNFARHYVQFCKGSSASPCSAPQEAPDVCEAKPNTRVSQEQHFLQECVKECTMGVESLSHVMNHVAAEVKVIKEKQQDLEVIVKGQGDVIQELSNSITFVAEKVNKVQEDVGTIAQRTEQANGLVKDISEIKRSIGDPSKVHWYVENVSQYIEKGKKQQSVVNSEVFVVRGYSVRLSFQVLKTEGALCIALFLRLCRGPNDSLLQWPLSVPYTLSLIHPKDASKTKVHKTTPPSAAPKCFEKPKDEENAGCGTGKLCTVEAAQNEGFIENDAVCFALTLHE